MLAIVMANIGMFSYAAIILRKLQKNLRSGAVTRSYTTQRSYSTQMSQETSENIPTLHRQYSRALSQGIDEVKSKIKKQKANAARFVINQSLSTLIDYNLQSMSTFFNLQIEYLCKAVLCYGIDMVI